MIENRMFSLDGVGGGRVLVAFLGVFDLSFVGYQWVYSLCV